MACVGGVSPVELACLVRQYLQEHSFVRSYEAFRYDAKALLVDVPNNGCVKSLYAILNEYVELKEQEAQRQKRTNNPLACKVYELLDAYCMEEAAAPNPATYLDVSTQQVLSHLPLPQQTQSRSRKKKTANLTPFSSSTPPPTDAGRPAFNRLDGTPIQSRAAQFEAESMSVCTPAQHCQTPVRFSDFETPTAPGLLCSSLGKSGRKRRAPKRLRTAEGSSDAAASLYNTLIPIEDILHQPVNAAGFSALLEARNLQDRLASHINMQICGTSETLPRDLGRGCDNLEGIPDWDRSVTGHEMITPTHDHLLPVNDFLESLFANDPHLFNSLTGKHSNKSSPAANIETPTANTHAAPQLEPQTPEASSEVGEMTPRTNGDAIVTAIPNKGATPNVDAVAGVDIRLEGGGIMLRRGGIRPEGGGIGRVGVGIRPAGGGISSEEGGISSEGGGITSSVSVAHRLAKIIEPSRPGETIGASLAEGETSELPSQSTANTSVQKSAEVEPVLPMMNLTQIDDFLSRLKY